MIKSLKNIFAWYFKKRGWRIEGGLPKGVKKCVLVAAPHTSNWDFVYGLGALKQFGYEVNYLAKKELFRFPFKKVFVDLGGIPVDRSKNSSLVESIIELINSREEIIVLFPPEGTRSPVSKWKSGFYWAAVGAKVPIVLGALDYSKKKGIIGLCFMPSGDIKKDFQTIRDYYKSIEPKFPTKFLLPEIK